MALPMNRARGLSSRSRTLSAGAWAWPAPRAILVALLTLAALTLGGGGSPSPRPELVLQLLAALAVAVWVFLPERGTVPQWWPVLAIALLVLVLPILQLIPLPPSLWQAMPGREVEKEALALVGRADSWMPWTTSPAATRASLLAMLAPLAAMLMTARLDISGRRLVVAVIAAMGLVSVALGTLQLAAGPTDWVALYPDSAGRVFGFQANRNAEVDVLLIALVAGAAWAVGRRGGASLRGPVLLAVLAAFSGVMLLAAVLTGSRTGIALIPVALIFVLAIVLGDRLPTGRVLLVTAALALLLGVMAWLLRDNGAIARVLMRFAATEDFRAELWKDTLYAIGLYWPMGSGLGTIVPVLIGVERLEVVDPTLPNRAHNDFLELALEGGVIGLLLLFAVAVLVALAAWRAWSARDAASRPLILFAVAALVTTMLHSIVDYPLRSMALAHVVGVAVGLLAPLSRRSEPARLMRE